MKLSYSLDVDGLLAMQSAGPVEFADAYVELDAAEKAAVAGKKKLKARLLAEAAASGQTGFGRVNIQTRTTVAINGDKALVLLTDRNLLDEGTVEEVVILSAQDLLAAVDGAEERLSQLGDLPAAQALNEKVQAAVKIMRVADEGSIERLVKLGQLTVEEVTTIHDITDTKALTISKGAPASV